MKRDIEYIAYAGKAFTIEWYFNGRGKSEALDYYNSLTMPEKIKVLALFKRMGDAGQIKDRTKFNFEGDQIFAFKPSQTGFCVFSM